MTYRTNKQALTIPSLKLTGMFSRESGQQITKTPKYPSIHMVSKIFMRKARPISLVHPPT